MRVHCIQKAVQDSSVWNTYKRERDVLFVYWRGNCAVRGQYSWYRRRPRHSFGLFLSVIVNVYEKYYGLCLMVFICNKEKHHYFNRCGWINNQPNTCVLHCWNQSCWGIILNLFGKITGSSKKKKILISSLKQQQNIKLKKTIATKMSLQKYVVLSNLVRILLISCVILLRLPKCASNPATNMYSDKVVSIHFNFMKKIFCCSF